MPTTSDPTRNLEIEIRNLEFAIHSTADSISRLEKASFVNSHAELRAIATRTQLQETLDGLLIRLERLKGGTPMPAFTPAPKPVKQMAARALDALRLAAANGRPLNVG